MSRGSSKEDVYLTLFDLIGQMARRRYQTAERSFSTLGLHHTEARLLTLLHEAKGTSTQETLSSALLVDRSNAGRALKRLERDGYVARSKDDADQRTKLVQLTAKGRKAVAEVARLKRKIALDLLGGLTEKDARATAELLRRALEDEEDVAPGGVPGRRERRRKRTAS